jgi:hypothetical protein
MTTKNKYADLTSDKFDEILAEIINEQPAASLLDIPGVYEAVSEHFNNEVLDRWEQD